MRLFKLIIFALFSTLYVKYRLSINRAYLGSKFPLGISSS